MFELGLGQNEKTQKTKTQNKTQNEIPQKPKITKPKTKIFLKCQKKLKTVKFQQNNVLNDDLSN